MNRPRLIYFDFAGSRGEECRIALHLAGVDFEDVRVQTKDWPAMKGSHFAFGSPSDYNHQPVECFHVGYLPLTSRTWGASCAAQASLKAWFLPGCESLLGGGSEIVRG